MTIATHKQEITSNCVAHVLIVSVDALVVSKLTATLLSLGCTVDDVATPKQALEVCALQSYQLTIIDEFLPGMTGPELAAALRESYKLPAAFLCSPNSASALTEVTPGLVAEAINLGSLGFISKPLD
jgi:CheY-like chemotaxis protein